MGRSSSKQACQRNGRLFLPENDATIDCRSIAPRHPSESGLSRDSQRRSRNFVGPDASECMSIDDHEYPILLCSLLNNRTSGVTSPLMAEKEHQESELRVPPTAPRSLLCRWRMSSVSPELAAWIQTRQARFHSRRGDVCPVQLLYRLEMGHCKARCCLNQKLVLYAEIIGVVLKMQVKERISFLYQMRKDS